MLALIVFGMKNELEPIGQVNFNCPNCGYTPTNLAWAHRKATVYWIPLFGMGTSYALSCDSCGLQTEIDEQLGQQLQSSLSNVTPSAPPAADTTPTYNPGPVAPAEPEHPTTVLRQPVTGSGQPTISFGSTATGGDDRTRHLDDPTTAGAAGGYAPATQAANPQVQLCVRCGAAVPDGAKFCQSCGTPVAGATPTPVRACANCGYVQSTGQFCNNCGSPLPAP